MKAIITDTIQPAIEKSSLVKPRAYAKIPDNKQICFIFGNEGDGIDKSILKVGKTIPGSFVICIRQLGALQSLNVSAAAAMIMNNYKTWAIKDRLAYLDCA